MEGQPPMSAELADKILHVSLPIGNTILMGSDGSDEFCSGGAFVMGNNITISINAESREEADRISKALSEGGQMTMPMADTFWGAYFGMWTDKFGINWMMNYDDPAKMQK